MGKRYKGRVVSRILCLRLHLSERLTRWLWEQSSPAYLALRQPGVTCKGAFTTLFHPYLRMQAVYFLWPYPSIYLAVDSLPLRRAARSLTSGLSSEGSKSFSVGAPVPYYFSAKSNPNMRNSARRLACSSASDSSG